MRKLLLAATAIMGATMGLANVASAQVAPPAVVVTPPPSPYAVLPSQVALPGTAVVRLNVRLFADVQVGGDSGDGYTTPAGVKAKVQPYFFGEYMRIYPGFDGVTPNGIKYGASAEIRQNSGGTGVNQATNNIAGSGGNTLFWRRQTGYVGTAQLGTLRFGETDPAVALMMVGTFEYVDTEGGWNGDLPGLFSSASQINWIFPEDGAFYTTSKLVYLSPNFSGFDFGVSFEPSSTSTSNNSQACAGTTGNNVISLGCATVSSISGPYATISGDLARRRNYFDAIGRYRGAFGPVGLVVEGGYQGSGKVSDGNPGVDPVKYKGLSIVDGGIAVTFGGLAVGGHVDFGQGNGSTNGSALLQEGAKHQFAYIAGAAYAFGPFVVGATFLDEQYQGAWNGNLATGAKNTFGLRQEHGISVGGTFDWAPGISLYTDYLYGTRQQAGFDFYANGAGKTNNKTRAQGLDVGTVFRW